MNFPLLQRLVVRETCKLSVRLCSREIPKKEEETPLLKHIRNQIVTKGPISVHEYMREVLTNSREGYYMKRDVFGQSGDFTTSPEISQMFGEMIGIWMLNEWIKAGSPQPVQFIEIGPGRGTLSEDILRVFSKYKNLSQALHLRLVEISPFLSKIQAERLSGKFLDGEAVDETQHDHYQESRSKGGVPISWYKDIHLVPSGAYSLILAHEFLDALPIHKFQRRSNQWREIVIQNDESSDTPLHLKFVMSPNRSSTEMLLDPNEKRNHVEVCPEAGIFVEHVAERLQADGGACLLIDYGHNGDKEDTFRAFQKHKLHDPLSLPGTADLTADVDFSYLKRSIKDRAAYVGPVLQGHFLMDMGISVRFRKLLEYVRTKEEADTLYSGFDMLVDPEKMGERFKFFSIFPKSMENDLKSNPPAGF